MPTTYDAYEYSLNDTVLAAPSESPDLLDKAAEFVHKERAWDLIRNNCRLEVSPNMPHTPLGRLAMRYGAEHALIVVNHGRRTDPQSQVVAAAEMAYDSGHGATYIGNIAVRPSERGLNHGLTILYEAADASLARDIGLIITTFADLEDPQLALQFGFSAPEEADVDPQLEGRLTARPEVVFGHAMQNMSSGSRIFPFTAGPSRWE